MKEKKVVCKTADPQQDGTQKERANLKFCKGDTVADPPPKPYEQIELGGIVYTCAYTSDYDQYEDPKSFDDLVHDIALRGIQCPIVLDEWCNVIDGKRRLRAAKILGGKNVPVTMIPGLTEPEKWEWAQALNIHRRHLTPAQIQEVVRKNRMTLTAVARELRQQGMSLRQIADQLGVSHECIRDRLQEDDLPGLITGKDGKQRASKIQARKVASISINTARDTQRAMEACQIAQDELPQRPLSLHRAERTAREKQAHEVKEQQDIIVGNTHLLYGDFRIKGEEIADASVDMFLIDPPYSKEALSLFSDAATFAARKLKPGGILATYSGTLYLPDVMNRLGEHLTYVWACAIEHTGGRKLVPAVRMLQRWKPVLVYARQPVDIYWSPFPDLTSGGQEKEHHPWEQPATEAQYFIKALCPKEGVLVDCFMGSGSSIVGALNSSLGLTCYGIEQDKAAFATAQTRIQQTIDEIRGRKESA
jgi:ParB-like chromosome segregation protein Spo0J